MTPTEQNQERPIINVVGEKVALGPIHRGLLPLYWRWFNDFAYLRTTSKLGPMTMELLEKHYQHSSLAEDEVHFAIYERSTMQPIGGGALTEIRDATATFLIGIGEKDCWGMGYGTEATRLTLAYGFAALGLRNVLLTVHSDNERGIRAYTRAGFRIMGRRRGVIERGGRLYDLIYMDCVASEFEGPALDQPL